jgi:outer membrane biosynthesis protein TonB
MDRVRRRARRRWEVSGLLSMAVHVALAVACFLGGGRSADRVAIERGAHPARETAIAFDLIPAALATPGDVDPILIPPAPPTVAPAPRHGHAVRRQRPAAEPATIRMPAEPNPLEPPALVDTLVEEPEPAPEPEPPAGEQAVAASVTASGNGTFLSAGEAGYLRTVESYPSVPGSLRRAGRVYTILAQVCVSPEGRVSDVAIKRGAAPELDHALATTMGTWRYRPRLVGGVPRPFCHLIKVDFAQGR